jgi:transposase
VNRYAPEIEAEMRAFFQSLNEKDRRRYAAIEARKLGYGGSSYIAQVLGCERHTVATGLAELNDPEALALATIRQPGGGRKPALEVIPKLEETFLEVLANHTAGSPTNEAVKWTNLRRREIVERLSERGIKVSVRVVKQLLDKHKYVRRKAQKREAMGEAQDRNEQFEQIAQLKAQYLDSPNPVLSMDTKKKS